MATPEEALAAIPPSAPSMNYHPAMLAADAHNIMASRKSITAGDVGEFFTKGTQVALASGMNSLLNTGIDIANFFGSSIDRINTLTALQNYDNDLAKYYRDHQEGADLAGFVITSLVPGAIGMKGFNMLKAVKNSGVMGLTFENTLGWAAGKQSQYVKAAAADIAAGEGSMFGIINRNKLLAITAGFGDQALQAAAFETAVAATMYSSPILDKMSWSDLSINILKGAAIGGVIGGSINGLLLGGDIAKQVASKDAKDNLFRFVTAYGNMSGATGDKITSMLKSLDELSATAIPSEASLKIKAKNDQWLRVTTIATEAAAGDAELGNALVSALRKVHETQLIADSAGGLEEAFKHSWSDLLQLAKSFRRIGEDQLIHPEEIFYIGKGLGKQRGPEDIFSTTKPVRLGPNGETIVEEGATAYHVVGDPATVKIGYYGAPDPTNPTRKFYGSTKAAMDDGVDIFFNQNLTASINKNSKVISTIHSPTDRTSLIWDVRTGSFTQTAVPTVGDMARGAGTISLARAPEGYFNGLNINGRVFTEESIGSYRREINGKMTVIPFDYLQATALEANARYVYFDLLAEEKNWRKLLFAQTPNAYDLPHLEAISTKYKSLTEASDKKFITDALVVGRVGTKQTDPIHPLMLDDYILARKQEIANRLVAKGDDLREVAQKVNSRESWIEGNFQGTDGAFVSSAEHRVPRSVIIQYDTADPIIFSADGKHVLEYPGAAWVAKGMAGLQERIQLAQEATRNVAASIFGDSYANLPEISSALVKAKANSLGAGSSFWGAANANYESFAQLTQTIGKETKLLVDKLTTNTFDALASVDYAIRNDKQAAAQLGIVTAMLRRSEEKYFFHPSGTPVLVTKGLRDWLVAGKAEADYVVPAGYQLESKVGPRIPEQVKFVKHILDEKVAAYLGEHVARNDIRITSFNAAREAWGKASRYEPGAVYVPPIDTRKYPFIAFVREVEGKGGAMGDVGMLTASSEAHLAKLMAEIDTSKYSVISKKSTDDYFKAKGDYDYALSFHENVVNSELKSKGLLGEFIPETKAEAILGDYVDWHTRMETKLARTGVELQYGQQIAELRVLGQQFTELAASKAQGIGASALARVANPFEDYVKSMMNISRKDETQYKLWRDLNEFAEQSFTTAFNTATAAFEKAAKGTISFEAANAEAARFGLGAPFATAASMITANLQAQRPILTKIVGKMNAALAAVTLRLDVINPIINVISTPILAGTEIASIRANITDPAIVGRLGELLTTKLGDGVNSFLSPTKLMAQAMSDLMGPRAASFYEKYTKLGTIRGIAQQHHDMLDQAGAIGLFAKDGKIDKLSQAADKMVELGSKLTGNNWAEDFTRAWASRVMDIITETAGLTGKEANGYISTYVNRVQGNYIAAQRPILFQGALGQSISLFQTYQFNLLQQAFRHIANGDAKTVAIFAGLQSSLYGMQGLPAFNFLNTQLIGNAAGNLEHKDLYTGVRSVVGKDIGDFILHGLASNAFTIPVGIYNELTGSKVQAPNLALYSRGDINPRHITVIPNPLHPEELPAVSATIKVVANILNVGKNLANGGALGAVLTQGLEHNGVSRPLMGIAQLMQGYSTTSKGGLVASNTRNATAEGFGYSNDLWLVSAAGRAAGAKPLQEALALDALYRLNAYKAKDQASIQYLGQAVKTTLVAGGTPSEAQVEDFVTRYTKAGGKAENFNRFMLNATKASNTSVVNAVTQHLQNPAARRMMEIMGDQPLPDFSNQAALQ